MSWFKIDDGFHCHPKVYAAGTPAVGLYVRCGSWAAQQATEGVVPRAVARQYGTPRMIKALVDAGLWHTADHDCDACLTWHPSIPADSFLIHEYLGYNPTKEATLAARAAKNDRQRRWREGRRKNASDAEPEANSMRVDANSEGNSMRVDIELAPTSHANSEQNRSYSRKNEQVNGSASADVDASTRASRNRRGDACPDPTRPDPTPVPPTEVLTDSEPDRLPLPVIGDRPRIPTASRPLVDALTNSGMVVGWDLTPGEWILIESLIRRCGIPALVRDAEGSWQGARSRPRTGKYFLPAWRKLPDIPETARNLPAVLNGPAPEPRVSRQQQDTDDMFNRAMARAIERDRQQGAS